MLIQDPIRSSDFHPTKPSVVYERWFNVALLVASVVFLLAAVYGGLGSFAGASTLPKWLAIAVGAPTFKGSMVLFCVGGSLAVAGGISGVILLVRRSLIDKPKNDTIPLHQAIEQENKAQVEWLLKRGANPNILNYGKNPLDEALNSGNAEIIYLLLRYGAHFEAIYLDYQDMLLKVAVKYGTPADLSSLILYAPKKVNTFKDKGGKTLLHLAAERGSLEHVKVLINAKAIIDATDDQGETPFMVACRQKECLGEVLQDLKNAGVNFKNLDGNTALHLVMWHSNTSHIELLVNLGADVFIKNNKGQTPMRHIEEQALNTQSFIDYSIKERRQEKINAAQETLKIAYKKKYKKDYVEPEFL